MLCHGLGYSYLGGMGSFFGILLQIAVFIGGIYLITRLFFKNTTGNHALTIVEEQYARGEITREEYLERKNVLVKGK